MLERQQDATANIERVLERLEARRDHAPLVVAEVGVGRATRHDQIVVRQFTVSQDQSLAGPVDFAHLGKQHFDVRLAPQNPADRRSNVPRGQRGHRHLIEQRLKDMVVAAVDDGDPDPGAPERAGRIQPAESPADDDDMVNT